MAAAEPAAAKSAKPRRRRPSSRWAKLAREIGIIVVGVLLALAAEQTVEAISWRQRADTAERVMSDELSRNLTFAAERGAMERCADRYLALLERAVLASDTATIQRLAAMERPFRPRPWRTTSWDATLSTQVADHLDSERLGRYALVFTSIGAERDRQFAIAENFVEALSGRFAAANDSASRQLQLIAIDKLRQDLRLSALIAQQLLDESREGLGVSPAQRWVDDSEARAKRCERAVSNLAEASRAK